MKKSLLVLIIALSTACNTNSNKKGSEAAAQADSSNVITDSNALMNIDTTSVTGANGVKQGQMKNSNLFTASNTAK